MEQFNRGFIKRLGTRALVGTMGAFLVVCSASGESASQQTAMKRLEQARATFAQAKNSPIVESYALKKLLIAEKTLNQAESARKKASDPNPMTQPQGYSAAEQDALFDDVSRLAYMANREAQGALAFAEGMVAGNDKLKLGKEKAEVLLQKSSIEKKRLQRDVEEMISALERSRQELNRASSEAERARIMADIQATETLLAKARAAAKDKETEEARALAAASAKDAERARLLAVASAYDAERAKAELAQLLKELSELQGQLTDRGIVLTVGDVLFATGKADLNASAQGSMDKIAAFLRKNPNRNLLVEGNTDSVGGDEYNQGLSEERAASVKSALVRLSIASERIVTIGYGKRFPVSSNEPERGRQQNRRVDVVILNEGVKPESQFKK